MGNREKDQIEERPAQDAPPPYVSCANAFPSFHPIILSNPQPIILPPHSGNFLLLYW